MGATGGALQISTLQLRIGVHPRQQPRRGGGGLLTLAGATHQWLWAPRHWDKRSRHGGAPELLDLPRRAVAARSVDPPAGTASSDDCPPKLIGRQWECRMGRPRAVPACEAGRGGRSGDTRAPGRVISAAHPRVDALVAVRRPGPYAAAAPLTARVVRTSPRRRRRASVARISTERARYGRHAERPSVHPLTP